MSTDLTSGVQTPIAGKKAKKAKSDDTASMKKRKREQEVLQSAEQIPGAGEPSKKKTKKAKGVNGTATTESVVKVEDQDQKDAADSNGTSRPGKEKKKKAKKVKADDEAANVSPSTTKHSEKKGLFKRTQADSKDAVSELWESERLRTGSPFVQETTSFYLALSPCAYDFPLEGLCAEHISPLLLTYYPPLKGVVLSYSNPRMSEHPDASQAPQAGTNNEAKTVLSKSIDEYAVTFVWLTAEFTIFRPRCGTHLEGYVNLQNESILGLVCYNYFSAGIESSRLPKDWRWVGDDTDGLGDSEGHYVDGDGKRVEGRLVFRVQDFEAVAGSEGNVGSISVQGTLLSKEEEQRMDDDERQLGLVS